MKEDRVYQWVEWVERQESTGVLYSDALKQVPGDIRSDVDWIAFNRSDRWMLASGGGRGGGGGYIANFAKQTTGQVIKQTAVTNSKAVTTKWWHPGYVDKMSSSQILLGVKESVKGLSTLGSASRAEVMKAGLAWVGEGAKTITSKGGDIIGYSSKDGMRAFRLQYKAKENMWRGNFTENTYTVTGGTTELRNVHVDIFE